MPGGKHNTIPRVPPHLRAEGNEVINPASLPKSHISAGKHRDTLAKPQHDFRDQLSDQASARIVFIEFGRSGIAVPCLFQPFIHNGVIGRG